MIKSKNRLKKTIVGMITFVLAFFLLPFQGLFAAPQEIKDDTDLSALSLYQFQLTTDNMSVVSKSSAVQQYHMDAPGFGDLQHKYPGYPMENFTLKIDKTKKEDQTFDKPLSLKFTNAGTVNGKQVDAYLTINKVTLHYINNSEAPAQMADVNKKTVNFFNVSNLWGANQFEIGNIAYVDEAHDDVMKNTFTVDADITAELKYSDGSEPDMKLVMKPTDIDANGDWNTKEAFYVTNYNTSVDKRVMNNRNNLEAVQEGDKTVWNAGPGGTSGSDAENNISGLALRSVNNTMNFGYRSANHASATFSLYVEQAQFAPEKKVEPAQIPAQAGEAVTYKTLFRIPEPGKEIIAALSSLDFVDTFDDRLDFKDLTVDANGVALTEGVDYTVEKSGQKVTVKMAAAYLNKDKAGTPIRITYNTVTNNKVGEKASGPIENIVAMKPDNLYIPSNKVTTTLLYNKIHEFESGTPGKTLPQEVKNLLPAKVSGLANGTTVNPTQPTTTKVSVPEGNWVFKGYDKDSEVVENGDVKFIGKWEFTPAPTYKATHEFVSGTPGKELPQEVKSLLPADQTDLKDGSQATPTQPSQTEVKTAEGTWSFKSYDKASETINGADAHFVGTWEFTPAPTYKATHEFVSGTPGKDLPQEVKSLLPADQTDLKDGSQATPTQPSQTEVKTAEGTWSFKSYDKASETINGADAHFVGTWEFTPAPTYKATHEFVSGTPGKDLPQEVKSLLPADQTDLKDGSQATPTQPSQTEVKTAEGTWSFKSYDKASETINGADAHFIGTWEFTPAPQPQPKTGNVDVKYVDEDGNEVAPSEQVKTNAPVGEDYTTSPKNVDGYEFVKLSPNSASANGKVTEGDSHVVYVYKKKTPAPQPQPKTGNVDVKYVDEDGNEVAPSEQVKTNAPVGEDYTTSPKNVDGYEFVKLSPNSASANGKVTEGDSHVVYVYKKKTPAPQPQPKTGNVDVKYVDEDGNEVAPSEQVKTNAPVGEDYTTSPKNVDGYEFVKLSPNSASANGKVTEGDSHVVYVYKKKTPAPQPQPKTGNVDVKYVDEDGNEVAPSEQVKTNAPVGEDYTTSQKTFDGYEFKALSSDSAPANGKVTEGDSHVVYVYKKKTPAPTVHPITSFVDTKGNTLIPSEDGEQPKKDIPGYRFVETKKLPNGDTEHVYEKVKTSHKDKEGNDIPGYPSEDGEQPKKDIPGYRFVETKKLPNGDTEHIYEKVKTSFKDKEGNEIPNYLTEDGEQPKKDIPGYRFVETKKLPNGDTEHVYEKVKTSHKDKEGNDIPGYPSEDGEQPKKDIPGYRFVETKKLPNGDTEHVYEKVKTSHKDKEGNDIPGYPSEDGEQPKKDIPGYRFVETKKLPNGDTEHVYEKVKTSHKDKEGNDIPGYPSEDGEQPKKDIPGYRFVETKKLPNGDTEHVYEKVVTAPQQKPTKATKELPNTGTEDHSSLAALGLLGVLSGFGLVARKKKED